MVTLTIDHKTVTVPEGTTILEAARSVRLDFDLKAVSTDQESLLKIFASIYHRISHERKGHVTIHFKANFKAEFLRAYSKHLEVLFARISRKNDVFGGIFGNAGAGYFKAFPSIYGSVIGFVLFTICITHLI